MTRASGCMSSGQESHSFPAARRHQPPLLVGFAGGIDGAVHVFRVRALKDADHIARVGGIQVLKRASGVALHPLAADEILVHGSLARRRFRHCLFRGCHKKLPPKNQLLLQSSIVSAGWESEATPAAWHLAFGCKRRGRPTHSRTSNGSGEVLEGVRTRDNDLFIPLIPTAGMSGHPAAHI